MARTKMLGLLAVSVILSVLLAMAVMPAAARDTSYAGEDGSMSKDYSDKDMGDRCKCGCDRDGGMPRERMGERMEYRGMHKGPKDIYMAVSGGSMTGSTASFNVDSIGMAGGKKGLAATVTFASPLTGTYNTSDDMGYISMTNALPMTIVVDKVGSTSMPAGNASAIIGLHGVKTLTREKGYKVSEFKAISVFLSDGTVKYFKLDEPVKITHSMDRKMVVIDAYPTFTQRMGQVFSSAGGGTTGMAMTSMTMADLKSMEAKAMAQPETIEYEKPAYVAPPT